MTAPLPPSDLHDRTPVTLELAEGSIVHRFHDGAYGPIFFDRGRKGRLNAPDGSYGVLYAAERPEGAFAETFLREPGRTLLPLDLVQAKAYARLVTHRPMTLVRLAGPGLGRIGATAEVVHAGLPYDTPQSWSKALRDHPSRPDGIAYRARHDDDALCYAFFESTGLTISSEATIRDLDVDWFWHLALPYGVGLAPS